MGVIKRKNTTAKYFWQMAVNVKSLFIRVSKATVRKEMLILRIFTFKSRRLINATIWELYKIFFKHNNKIFLERFIQWKVYSKWKCWFYHCCSVTEKSCVQYLGGEVSWIYWRSFFLVTHKQMHWNSNKVMFNIKLNCLEAV